MTQNEKVLAAFEARVRQLILRFQELKKENSELYAMIEKQEQDIKNVEAKMAQTQRDYDSLKMAKMLEVTDGDLEGAKKRVASLIRDVNSCITLLSGSEE